MNNESSVLCCNPEGYHRITYREYGDPQNNNVIICAHGLTRNSHDFDVIAEAICDEYRVITVNIVGRGTSDWLPNKALYTYHQYAADFSTLFAKLDVEEVTWIGTSLGGSIGMIVASRYNTPITKLIVNDIAPHIDASIIKAVSRYCGSTPVFDNLEQVTKYLRKIYTAFGNLSDEHWDHIAKHTIGKKEGGKYRLAFDPAISYSILEEVGQDDVDFWHYWDKIACPTLVIHGTKSAILSAENAEEMGKRGPKPEIMHIEDTGHAPPLMDEMQISRVREWLAKN